MANVETMSVRLAGIELVDASTGRHRDLGGLDGVHVVVLIRHRH